jgi:hypothetical protein
MNVPMKVRFTDRRSAHLALDTLTELGFHAHMGREGGTPEVHVFLENNDLTSALEIVQSHGGELLESAPAFTAPAAYTLAYGLDGIPIPAHFVSEEEPEGDAEAERFAGTREESPSGETYDHFSADVRF